MQGGNRWSGGREESGASRARTGDLLDAIQTLSQLSYGPEMSQSSAELEVFDSRIDDRGLGNVPFSSVVSSTSRPYPPPRGAVSGLDSRF